MTVALDLNQAADYASGNLYTLWTADTLKTKVIAFWQSVNGLFPDETVNNQPVGNWIAIIAAFAPSILNFEASIRLGVPNTLATYTQIVDYVYRMFKLADVQVTAGLLSSAQGVALLAAYNLQFS
jgi:hypothetical protein